MLVLFLGPITLCLSIPLYSTRDQQSREGVLGAWPGERWYHFSAPLLFNHRKPLKSYCRRGFLALILSLLLFPEVRVWLTLMFQGPLSTFLAPLFWDPLETSTRCSQSPRSWLGHAPLKKQHFTTETISITQHYCPLSKWYPGLALGKA